MPRIVMSDDDSDEEGDEPVEEYDDDEEESSSGNEANVSSEEASDDEEEELEESEDSGEKRDDLPVSTTRPRRSGPSAPNTGARILARFEGKKRWYPATVRAANADGTFAVDYQDGDFEERVLADHVKPDPSHLPNEVRPPPPMERARANPSGGARNPAEKKASSPAGKCRISTTGASNKAGPSSRKAPVARMTTGPSSQSEKQRASARMTTARGSGVHLTVLDDDDSEDVGSSAPLPANCAKATAAKVKAAKVKAATEVIVVDEDEDDEEDNELCDTCGEDGVSSLALHAPTVPASSGSTLWALPCPPPYARIPAACVRMHVCHVCVCMHMPAA